MVTKVGLEEVSSWLGCAWVNCGGFLIRFLGYPFISRAWATLEEEKRVAQALEELYQHCQQTIACLVHG